MRAGAVARSRTERGSLEDFVGRHLVAWEVTMGVLAIAYLTVDVLADDGANVPVAAIAGFSALFFGVFAARFLNARSRSDYLRHHWLDLISSVPMVGGLRAIRLLRLVRLVRVARALGAIDHQATLHGRSRSSLSFLMPALLIAWFAAAFCYWSLEHNINPDARTFGDALYRAFLTMTTVGYGTGASLHADTRVLAGVVIFVGIGLVSVVSGHVTSMLLQDDDNAAIRAQLSEIETELRRLRLSVERREEVEA
jgi:voltage-gated potassium channel